MRGILGSQWRRYRLHLKTKHQEHILNVKSELKSTHISSTDAGNVMFFLQLIGGELVRDKHSDETIKRSHGSLRDKNYASEQALEGRKGGGSFPSPIPDPDGLRFWSFCVG